MPRTTVATLSIIFMACSQLLNIGVCQTTNNESASEIVVKLVAENTKLRAEIQNLKKEIENLQTALDKINRIESPSHLPPTKVEFQ
jgi:uncharacterized protein YlxW (UPF0749 family)